MNRRDFLSLTASAAAMPFLGCAATSCARRIAPGKRIRVALIGCGLRMRHVLSTKCGDEQVVALVDPDRRALDDQRARLVKMYPGRGYETIPAFATYQDLFAKMGDDLDAVLIATNQQQHALPALLAMQRGIHVYIEKPIAYSIEEADLLLPFLSEDGTNCIAEPNSFCHSTPFSPIQSVPIWPSGTPCFFSSSSTMGGRFWYSRFVAIPMLFWCLESTGTPSLMPSHQWIVTGSMPLRAGNLKSIVWRSGHEPGAPSRWSNSSALTGSTSSRRSAKNEASMMWLPMLPMLPLPKPFQSYHWCGP